ncbi:hypothetical protein M9H77_20824 [Catharanthus roseus]|uniref:Uncharacterized protein n=1 Tax=Catharanthus roseus TaxID=4058 RepID=A0ACC0APT6_CATRO|nr:hypothetical protein M9H77_20824 [Catharanthus roseus]
MATSENWQLLVHDGRHNHAIGVYYHGHTQSARLTEEQPIKTEQFRKSHMPPRNIAQKLYNVLAKMKKKMMQTRNTVEEVLCLSAQRGYTVFYRNCNGTMYNMSLLEAVGMNPTGKNVTVATAFMQNEQATMYR